MPEINDQMKRLQVARQKAEQLARERSRVLGELKAKQDRIKELEQKSMADFDCPIGELPAMVEEMLTSADKALAMAEAILEGKAVPAQDTVTHQHADDDALV